MKAGGGRDSLSQGGGKLRSKGLFGDVTAVGGEGVPTNFTSESMRAFQSLGQALPPGVLSPEVPPLAHAVRVSAFTHRAKHSPWGAMCGRVWVCGRWMNTKGGGGARTSIKNHCTATHRQQERGTQCDSALDAFGGRDISAG